MTERLQQLRGESLSNEQQGNAPALTIARPPECVDEDVCSGIHDLLVVIYGAGGGLRGPGLSKMIAANTAFEICDPWINYRTHLGI